MRSEVEHHLATAANTMLTAWNSTNQSFTSRIGESAEAHSSLQAQYSLTLQEMYDLGRHIASIKLAIKARMNSRQCLVYASLFAHIDYKPLNAYIVKNMIQ